PFSVVFMCFRPAEINHQCIAQVFSDVTAKTSNRGCRASLIRGDEVAPVFEIQVGRDLGRVNQVAKENRQMSALTLTCHGSRSRRERGLNLARTAWCGWRLCYAAIDGKFGAAVAAEPLTDRAIGATCRTASAKRRPAVGTKSLAFRIFCIAVRTAHWFPACPVSTRL